MARRYRRTGRYSRRLKTVKYSNETMCASKDVNGYTKMTLIAATTIQGMRKCKNFELKINVDPNAAEPSNNAIIYALVYVPENTQAGQLFLGDTDASNLYQPSQNIIMSGYAKPGNSIVNINRTRLARNLNQGDSIQLVLLPVQSMVDGIYAVSVTLNYAITY